MSNACTTGILGIGVTLSSLSRYGRVLRTPQGQGSVFRLGVAAHIFLSIHFEFKSTFSITSQMKQKIKTPWTTPQYLLLAEEGRLSLSDNVRKNIPELYDYGLINL